MSVHLLPEFAAALELLSQAAAPEAAGGDAPVVVGVPAGHRRAREQRQQSHPLSRPLDALDQNARPDFSTVDDRLKSRRFFCFFSALSLSLAPSTATLTSPPLPSSGCALVSPAKARAFAVARRENEGDEKEKRMMKVGPGPAATAAA